MKIVTTFSAALLVTVIVVFSACRKDDETTNTGTNTIIDPCNQPNGSMRWTFNGVAGCANASLFADAAIVLTAMGMQSSGETLVFELDSMNVGTYTMDENVNTIVYTDNLSMGWIISNDQPGTLTILENNTSTNRIRLSVNCALKNVISGQFRQLNNCTLAAYYTE
ncbi:MAG: DUF6252 family protein [Flavobacteriales bacterium]